MAKVSGKYFDRASFKTETSSGNGSTTDFVLTFTPINGSHMNVYLDGLEQVFTTDFTVNVSTKTVSFAVAPVAAQSILFKYIAKV